MPKAYIPEEIEAAAISAYGAGFSQRDVCDLVGLQPRALRVILRSVNFPSMHNPETVHRPERYSWELRDIDPDTRAFVAILRNDPCGFCGARKTTIDHIEPQALGGTDSWDNFGALCRECNSSKHAKPLLLALLAQSD